MTTRRYVGALVRLSRALTMTPWLIGSTHIRAYLTTAGRTPLAVITGVQLSALFRMADAMGIDTGSSSRYGDACAKPRHGWPNAAADDWSYEQYPARLPAT